MLSREEFLALRPAVEPFDIEGHGKVFVKGLNAEELDAYQQTLIETGSDGRPRVKRVQRNVRAALVVRCLVDDKGERVFTDKDTAEVGKVDAVIVDKLYDIARRLSGMDTGETEALAEGFDSAQDDGSSSELP